MTIVTTKKLCLMTARIVRPVYVVMLLNNIFYCKSVLLLI